MSFTYGINKFDGRWEGQRPNKTFVYVHPVCVENATWDDLIGILRDASRIARKPEEKDTTCYWVGPFIIGAEGEGRAMDNVIGMADWIGFDLDASGWSLDRLLRLLRGIACVLYRTTQSRPYPNQRWRIILRLGRPYSCEEHGAIWRMMDDMLGGALDQRTHNANRILFVPAQWDGADNLFVVQDGEPLAVDTVLAAGYPARPAEPHYASVEYIGVAQRPDGKRIITERMERDFQTGAPHSGRFIRLLGQAAKYHRLNDWSLGDTELCEAAMAVSLTYAPGVKRQNPLREAQRALAWANATFAPNTALARLRDSHAYYLRTKRFWI